MNGKEYTSSIVLLISAKIISMQKRKTHAVIIFCGVPYGFFVAMRRPAKKDWVIPMYSTGSMKSITLIIFS
jgi:hypothetical protein